MIWHHRPPRAINFVSVCDDPGEIPDRDRNYGGCCGALPLKLKRAEMLLHFEQLPCRHAGAGQSEGEVPFIIE